MTLLLKQSTSVVVSFGPFVDKTDGVTLETGLVSSLDNGTTGIKLSKNGGALTIRHATVTATTYDAYGCYRVTLDTTDTNTLGTLRMAFEEAATCLPVWQDFMVVTANVWDSLHSTDVLDTSVVQLLGTAWLTPGTAGTPDVNVKLISGDTAAADNAEAFFDGTGYAGTNNVIPAVTTVNGLAANVITAAAIADAAIDNATFAADVGSTAYATNIIALAADKAIQNAALATAANLATVASYVDTEVAAILADTNELQTDWVNGGRLDLLIDAIKAKTDNLPADPADQSAVEAAIPSSGTIADAVLDEVVEGSTTMRQLLRLYASVLLNKASGGATATIAYRDLADTKARVTLTVDADGNRSAVSLDGS